MLSERNAQWTKCSHWNCFSFLTWSEEIWLHAADHVPDHLLWLWSCKCRVSGKQYHCMLCCPFTANLWSRTESQQWNTLSLIFCVGWGKKESFLRMQAVIISLKVIIISYEPTGLVRLSCQAQSLEVVNTAELAIVSPCKPSLPKINLSKTSMSQIGNALLINWSWTVSGNLLWVQSCHEKQNRTAK